MDNRPFLSLFPKFFQDLLPAELADLCRQVGLDGVNAVVRPGYVHPERLSDELPQFVESVRDAGGRVEFVTTDYPAQVLLDNPEYLDLIAAMGIPRFRICGIGQSPDPHQQIAQAREVLPQLADESARRGITAILQCHGGTVHQSFSSAFRLIEQIDSPGLRIQPDPGNMMHQEGYEYWTYGFALLGARAGAMGVKDVCWHRLPQYPVDDPCKGWRRDFCPIDEGLIPWPEVLEAAFTNGFKGPLIFHPFYHTDDRNRQLEALQREVAYLKGVMQSLQARGVQYHG